MRRARVGCLGQLIAGAIRRWMETMGEANAEHLRLAKNLCKNNKEIFFKFLNIIVMLNITGILYSQPSIVQGDRVGIRINTQARNPSDCSNNEGYTRRAGMDGVAVSPRTCTVSGDTLRGWNIEGYY